MFGTGMLPSIMTSLFRVDMGDQQLAILFTARPQLPYAKPIRKPKCRPLEGFFDGHRDYKELFETLEPPERIVIETEPAKKSRLFHETLQKQRVENREELNTWDPFAENPEHTDNPIKTIFVGRLKFDTTESTLKKEFQGYGPIKKIRLVKDSKTQKSRGYAFIEFESKNDFKRAFKNANGIMIDGKRVLVDFEKGRTQRNFVPRRLGGGVGTSRFRKEKGGESFLRIEEKKRREKLRREKLKEQAMREKSQERRDNPRRNNFRGGRRDDNRRNQGGRRDFRRNDRTRSREQGGKRDFQRPQQREFQRTNKFSGRRDNRNDGGMRRNFRKY